MLPEMGRDQLYLLNFGSWMRSVARTGIVQDTEIAPRCVFCPTHFHFQSAEQITYAIFRTFEEEWVWLVKERV